MTRGRKGAPKGRAEQRKAAQKETRVGALDLDLKRLERALEVAQGEKRKAEARRREITNLEKAAAKASLRHRQAAARVEAPYQKKIKVLRKEDDYWRRQEDVRGVERLIARVRGRIRTRDDLRRLRNLGAGQ